MLSSPAPGRPVTSAYGPRVHPISGKQSMHRGIDYGGRFPVVVAADGRVVKNGASLGASGFGYYLVVEHSNELRTLYAHGATRSKRQPGERMTRGDVVFISGSTGAATGDHLHFETHRKNRFGVWVPVDPNPYLTPPTEQLTDEEEDMMKPKVFERTGSRTREAMVVAPWIVGADAKQRGYRVLTTAAEILAAERMYARGSGTADKVDRAGYVAIQEQAGIDAASWERSRS
jgi:hypothetical protein